MPVTANQSGSPLDSAVHSRLTSELQAGPNTATFKSVYSFKSAPDGAEPVASLTDVNGTLYGTTATGGTNSQGTVFKIAPSGAETVLHSFTYVPDGSGPSAGLIDVGGTLYGTTSAGGANGYGTVFQIKILDGKYRVLYSFANKSDGGFPNAGLIDVNGTLYGTTAGGGQSYGTVFKITTSGEESVLHTFSGGSDGSSPESSLTNINGALYGTTLIGGASGNGTVYKITTSGAESVVYSFMNKPDGLYPFAALTNDNGTLYGTTAFGGAGCSNYDGCGTVFKVTTSGAETVIHSFTGGSDGKDPIAGLLEVNGALYGTTRFGGGSCKKIRGQCGTIFEINASGQESVLYRFAGVTNGSGPEAGLIERNGTLYGTTYKGGTKNSGSIFGMSL